MVWLPQVGKAIGIDGGLLGKPGILTQQMVKVAPY